LAQKEKMTIYNEADEIIAEKKKLLHEECNYILYTD